MDTELNATNTPHWQWFTMIIYSRVVAGGDITLSGGDIELLIEGIYSRVSVKINIFSRKDRISPGGSILLFPGKC